MFKLISLEAKSWDEMKHCDTEQFIMSFSFIQSKAKPFQFHLVLLCKICEMGHVIFLPISTQRISLEIIILSICNRTILCSQLLWDPKHRVSTFATYRLHVVFDRRQPLPLCWGTSAGYPSHYRYRPHHPLFGLDITCHVSRVHRCHEHLSQM